MRAGRAIGRTTYDTECSATARCVGAVVRRRPHERHDRAGLPEVAGAARTHAEGTGAVCGQANPEVLEPVRTDGLTDGACPILLSE